MLQRNISGSPLTVMTDPPQDVGPGETLEHDDLLAGFEPVEVAAEPGPVEVEPAAEPAPAVEPALPESEPASEPAAPDPAPEPAAAPVVEPVASPVPVAPAAPSWPPPPPPAPGSVVSI